MYCYQYCTVFDAGSLSVDYYIKGPPTAQKILYTEVKSKPSTYWYEF